MSRRWVYSCGGWSPWRTGAASTRKTHCVLSQDVGARKLRGDAELARSEKGGARRENTCRPRRSSSPYF